VKKRFLGALVAAASAATVVVAPAPAAQAWSYPTLAQILLADRALDNQYGFDGFALDFDIVTQAILQFPDLVNAASSSSSNLTVFLPTDQAFRSTYYAVTGTYIWSERSLFNALVGAFGLSGIEDILTYHIIGGARISYSTALASDGANLTTLNGQTIEVDVVGSWWKRVVLRDKATTLRDPMVIVPNVRASNGIAHAIDRVLLPTL
jgi:uncharacterized surface protein with fasciclin (FAS1) repeats